MVLGIEMDGLGEEVDGRVPVFRRKGFVPLSFQQLCRRSRAAWSVAYGNKTTATRTSAMMDAGRRVLQLGLN